MFVKRLTLQTHALRLGEEEVDGEGWSTYKPDYLGGEEELRRGNVHVEAAYEPGSPTIETIKQSLSCCQYTLI
jgi:hypothetical protein